MTYLDDREVGHWTLGEAHRRGMLSFECRKCWHFAQADAERLLDSCGPDIRLSEIERRARCDRCKLRNSRLLIQIRGMRGDRAWRPAPPRAGR